MSQKEKNTKLSKFLSKMSSKYGNKFELIGEYTNSTTKTTFRCTEHDVIYSQAPASFLRGDNGCSECSSKSKWSIKTFKKEAVLVHGDKYDYSLIEEVNTIDKLPIICKTHGVFKMFLHSHLKGQNCPKCAVRKEKYTTEEFISKSNKIHGELYDYTKTNYIDSVTPVIITCSKHGDFKKIPAKHISGQGCQKCAKESSINKLSSSVDEFVEMANTIHSGKYNYSKTNYVNMLTKITIICPKHGDFEQIPGDHLGGHGCSNCTSSISKEENDFFNDLGIVDVIRSSRKIIPPFQLDGYIESKKIGIEYCGLYFHSSRYVDKNYHLNKLNKCNENGIRLLQIFSDEWLFKKEIVISRIRSILGVYKNKIYARKCDVSKIGFKEAKTFLDENHLQGHTMSSLNYGLYHNGELVSLMSFNKPRGGIGGKKYDYEMSRYCVKKHTQIIGGGNKLMKFIEAELKGYTIVTYADRRWSEGDIYPKLGFDKVQITKPNYSYIVGKKREFRFKFRKQILISEGFDPNKTEEQIMRERGIYKIYDCGVITFSKKL